MNELRAESMPAPIKTMDGGQRKIYRDLIERRRASHGSALSLAFVAMTILHDHTATLDYLEQSLRDYEPDIVDLAIDPRFDPIRNDPRAQAILRTLNLSK